MRTARFWLLIVLAVLLPLRSALAQALPCTGGHSDHMVHATQGHSHAQGHDHGHGDHSAPEAVGHSAGHDHGNAASDTGQCSACATCCAGAPAASAVASLLPILSSAALKFSSWSAPVPSVVPDGLDRPPRSV